MSWPMPEGAYRVGRPAGGPASVVLDALDTPGVLILIRGYEGGGLPPEVHDPRLERDATAVATRKWLLECREGRFEFLADGVDCHEARPGLFDPMLAGFVLRPRDRRVVWVLLRLLRLPGGAWLLRLWHGSRR